MPSSLSLTVTGQQALEAALDQFKNAAEDLRAPFTGLAQDVLRPIFARRFADSGPGWAPLSPTYAKWKAKHYPGKGILVRTGALQRAFSGGVGWEVRVTATSLEIDPSRVPYWRFHQEGSGKLPARPIVALTSGDTERVTDYVQKYLVQKAGALGFRVGGGV